MIAGDFILKLIDPPTLTLNGSAKPWIVVLGLVTSQTDCGVPGNWFSHATGLAHAARAGAAGAMIARTPAKATVTGTARSRTSRLRSVSSQQAKPRLRAWAPEKCLLTECSPPPGPGTQLIRARVLGWQVRQSRVQRRN